MSDDKVETIYEVITRLSADIDDADVLADKAMSEVGMPAHLVPVFYPLLRHTAAKRLRYLARANEPKFDEPTSDDEAAAPDDGRVPGERSTATRATAITVPEWLPVKWFFDDGTGVTWADATIADHERRIREQLKRAHALKHDIDLHTEAINRIKAGGVECLGDLREYGGPGPKAAAA